MLVKFEQNRIFQTIQNFVLFDKNGKQFLKSFDAILEDAPVTETIVWCQNIDLKTIISQCS